MAWFRNSMREIVHQLWDLQHMGVSIDKPPHIYAEQHKLDSRLYQKAPLVSENPDCSCSCWHHAHGMSTSHFTSDVVVDPDVEVSKNGAGGIEFHENLMAWPVVDFSE